MLEHLRKHLFFYTLIPLVIVMAAISYYRYIDQHNYVVNYEGECDALTQVCFTGCEDDDCTEKYYYAKMQNSASWLYETCGPDITECEAAYICLPDQKSCSVQYCDPEIDGELCEMFTESGVAEPEL